MSAENFGRALGRLVSALFGKRTRGNTPRPRPTPPTVRQPPPAQVMDGVESDWRLPPIPSGFQIYEARISVAGLSYKKENALRFIRSSEEHSLEFEREPTNPIDKNAIKIIGVAGNSRYEVGYVPADIAKQLASSGLSNLVLARLERAYAGSNDYVDLIFQVIGKHLA